MLVSLTFDLEHSRVGGWVWGPRGLLRGFQFHPPSRKDSRMDRRRRALLSRGRLFKQSFFVLL